MFMVLYGMFRICFLICFSLLLNGCGILDLLSSKNDSDGSFRHYDNPSDLQTSFETSYTTCNPGDCPSFAAGLFAIGYDESGRRGMHACSATLVSANRILTNSHCVPDDLHHAGADCRGRIRFSFPNTSHYKGESVMCGRVVAISLDTPRSDEPDWAVLEMVRTTPREPVIWSPGEIPAGQPLNVYKFDFDLDTRVTGEGVLVPTKCQANTNYFKNNKNTGPIGPLVDISGCTEKLIHGNSGSGLLNSSNELVGILSSALFVEESAEDWAIVLRTVYPEIRQNSGGGSNLACVEYFNSSPLSDLCYFSSPTDYVPLSIAYQSDREQRADQESYLAGVNHMREIYALPVNENMQWTENVDALTAGLNIPVHGTGAVQVRALYAQIFQTQYPMFPECVPDTHPEVFAGSLLSLEPTDRMIDHDSLLASRGTEVSEKLYQFERVNSSTFRIEADNGYLLPPVVEVSLGITESVSIDLPVCP